ncbi:hypothetical protein [Streptomyces sp. MJM8645]|uniref:hypothetical protein n=1 Tax=Streptomycetaceae TaxID=2062 RepID=UPI0007AFBE12|nr:hypothetical protein [Streptomyces sp. MJM8645]
MVLLPVPSKHKPRRRPNTPELAPEVRADLIERYNAGASMRSLAAELGHTDTWLKTRFRLWEVHIRDRSEAGRLRWTRTHAAQVQEGPTVA